MNKKIPTIVITAFDDAGIRERSAASGAKAFLTKPLHGPTLIDAIINATMDSVEDNALKKNGTEK